MEKLNNKVAVLPSRPSIDSTAIDEAIAIVLNAMAELEDESEHNERWYLPYMQLLNTFHHLCGVKFGLV